MQATLIQNKSLNQLVAWTMVAIAAIFYSYEFILRVAPSTMFDELIAFYHITATDVGNVVIFYSIAYTPMQLLVGPLFDKYGIKKLLVFAVLSCILGAYLLSAVNSIWVCRAGLFLMGLGSAFAFVGVLKLAASTVNRKYLGLASGITTALGMVGAICGQSITAYINFHFDWKYSWWLYAIVGAIIFVIIALFIKEPEHMDKKANQPITKSFFNELLLLARNKTVLSCGLVGGVLYMPVSVFGSLWGVPYLTSLSSDISTIQAANTITMVFLGMIIGCPLAGILSRYLPSEKILMHGSISAVILTMLLIFVAPISLTFMGIILFLMGLVCGSEVLTFTLAVEKNPSHLAGSAVAFVNFIMMAITGLMQWIVGYTLDYVWNGTIINGIPIYNAKNYQIAISTIPILSAFITLIFIYGVFRMRKSSLEVCS